MNFPEAQLSDPVCAWLRAQGLRVYVEVPWFGRAIDVVGVNGAGRIVAVELKQGLGHAVIRQAHQVQSSTWETYCAVRRKPRADGEHFERCRRYGIGVLLVDPSAGGEAVRVLIEPRDTGAVFGASAGRLLCRCEHMAEGGTGGMPNTLGNGPAQAVLRAVREFRRSNPGTNWREIYDKVPNHYASARSMQGALRNIEKWARIKALLAVIGGEDKP